ncbi:phosphatidylinositol phosphodiesterase [Bacillus sp. BB51/4]|uniref:phosphatidylinositol-specific phospholipase C n=1 Tax=Bacillus sp. BB51/4 TaxID=2217819 RepID=UPI0011EBDA15|nr:phosphatidylinositol-specific phospholipase C [Bacillus sp. BB51/4]KAA0768461.1 phosphatidylinositol phosphodiesterase [Bacillus sp. BB51/4]
MKPNSPENHPPSPKWYKGDYDKYRDGYAYNENIGYENKNWMSVLRVTTKISQLSIPGTHGSTALHGVTGGSRWIINQRMSITTQLNSGIRYLDIRARRTGTAFAMHHGAVYQKKMFGDILNEVTAFLRQHSGETVLMRLKEEHTPEPGSQSFEEILKGYWDNPSYKNYFWQPAGSGNGSGVNANPELKDVRGKIVLLQQFSVSKAYGINYSNLEIQDHDNVRFSMDGMYAKWTAVKNHLIKGNSDQNKIYLNHLSGNGGPNGGCDPQFVASGYKGGGDDEPLMGIGSPSQYPDFPTENYRLYYGGMNIMTTQYIPRSGLEHTGIVAADFPGKGLVGSIIGRNYRHINNEQREISIGLVIPENSVAKVTVYSTTGATIGKQVMANTNLVELNVTFSFHIPDGVRYDKYTLEIFPLNTRKRELLAELF